MLTLRIVMAAVVTGGYVMAAPISFANQVLASGPRAFYRLNESSGTTIVDSSGNGNNGNVIGGLLFGQAGLGGGGDNSIGFTNPAGYIQLLGAWGGGPELTIEVVFRQTGVAGGDFASLVGAPSGFAHFQTSSNGQGAIAAYTGVGPGDYVSRPAPAFDLGTEHYMAFSVTSNGSFLVYDNQLITSEGACCPGIESFVSVLSSNEIWIGKGVLGRWFQGEIDEVAIYNRALSADEIFSHRDSLAPVPEPSTVSAFLLGGLILAGIKKFAIRRG